MIRKAVPGDAAEILAIYEPYIRNTSLTFETEVPNLEAFTERIIAYLRHYPWLVYIENGRIAGYAYAARHRERIGYQWCTETSIYLPEEFQGKGIGRALYTAIFAILKKQGFRNVYAVINLPNEKSVSFHESCGFKWFATYENVGYKLGKWKNVGWWVLQLNEYISDPAAPLKFPELDTAFISSVLENAEKFVKSNK